MDADIQKIKKLTRFMRQNGLLELKKDGFELKLAPQALALPPAKPPAPVKETPKSIEERAQREQELLLWSSPDFHGVPIPG